MALQVICTACGRCVNVCPKGLHSVDAEGKHHFKAEDCIQCGACATACPTSALVLYGREVTVEQILPELLADKAFYEASGGGVTLSGGEPLLQPAFCRELLRRLKENGVSTAVDTCGFASRDAIDAVLEYTDTFLFDVKALDETLHVRATGQSNRRIIENLHYLDRAGKRIEVRIPFVPGYNDKEWKAIAGLLSLLTSLDSIKILPYHSYAEDKYSAIGKENFFCQIPIPDPKEVEGVRKMLQKMLPAIKVE